VEDPQARLAENIDGSLPDGATLPDNDDAMSSLPAISLRYEDSIDAFSYSIAGIARQLKYNTGSEKDTEMGYAAFLAGAYNAGPLTVRGIVNMSEGANSYLYLSGDLFNGADAYVNQNGALETLSGRGHQRVSLINLPRCIPSMLPMVSLMWNRTVFKWEAMR